MPVAGCTQLLPNCMHVHFADTMLVSPSSTPDRGVFERRDNYYVYLKPPVWIPMPPH